MLFYENLIKITNNLNAVNAQYLVSSNDHVSSKASPEVRPAQSTDEEVRKSSKTVKNAEVSISTIFGNASNIDLNDLIKDLKKKRVVEMVTMKLIINLMVLFTLKLFYIIDLIVFFDLKENLR